MEELTSVFASLEFASPLYFWLGGAVILLGMFLPFLKRKRELHFDRGYWKKKIKLVNKKTWAIPALIIVISLLTAAALANPLIVEKRNIPFYGKPVMVVVDVSGSMGLTYREKDSPLGKAREVFDDITKRDLGATIGLSLYSSESYIARDFTTKIELLKDALENEREIEEISTGTMTALALKKTREFFSREVEAKNKSIILISDLEDDLREVSREIKNCLEAGINLYVIVIQEKSESAHLSMQRLKNLIGINKVKMVWAEDKGGISQICEEIRQMESSLAGETEVLSRKSLTPFLLPAILGLTILSIVLSETIFRKIP